MLSAGSQEEALTSALKSVSQKIMECLRALSKNEIEFKQLQSQLSENKNMNKIIQLTADMTDLLKDKIAKHMKEQSGGGRGDSDDKNVTQEDYMRLEALLQKAEADNRNYLRVYNHFWHAIIDFLKEIFLKKIVLGQFQEQLQKLQDQKQEAISSTKQLLTQKNKEVQSLHKEIESLKKQTEDLQKLNTKQKLQIDKQEDQLKEFSLLRSKYILFEQKLEEQTGNDCVGTQKQENEQNSREISLKKKNNLSVCNSEIKHSSDSDLIKKPINNNKYQFQLNSNTISTFQANTTTYQINQAANTLCNQRSINKRFNNSNSVNETRSSTESKIKNMSMTTNQSIESSSQQNLNNVSVTNNCKSLTPKKNEISNSGKLNASGQKMLKITGQIMNKTNQQNLKIGEPFTLKSNIYGTEAYQIKQQQQQQLINQIKEANKEQFNKSSSQIESKDLPSYLSTDLHVFSQNNTNQNSFSAALQRSKRSKSQQGNRIKSLISSTYNSASRESSLQRKNRNFSSSLSHYNQQSEKHTQSQIGGDPTTKDSFADNNMQLQQAKYQAYSEEMLNFNPNSISFSQQQHNAAYQTNRIIGGQTVNLKRGHQPQNNK